MGIDKPNCRRAPIETSLQFIVAPFAVFAPCPWFFDLKIQIAPANPYPPPHFHAKYGEYEITVTIENGLVSGQFPKRALAHVLEWLEMHKPELLEDWELAKQRQPLKKVSPLE